MEKAEEAGKAMVLVNPALKDIPSHSGIMGVRCARQTPHPHRSMHVGTSSPHARVCEHAW